MSIRADRPITARTEIKKHGAGNNILIFWAYDDGTSTFLTLQNQEPLIIIDGRKCGAQDLLDKADGGMQLTKAEQDYMVCADTCDYIPNIESYGQYFMPKAKVAMEQTYLESDEYI